MAKLKSRERFPPGGFRYYQPESQFSTPPNASFEQCVQALIQHRRGNPHLVNTHGWSIDPETVRNEIDSFTARMCKQLGYSDYIYEGAPDPEPPKKAMPSPSLVSRVAAGAETIIEWLGDGGKAVDKELAERRAATCATCNFNSRMDFSTWFIAATSHAIRLEIGRKNEMKLETTQDEKLGVCSVCSCPMALKVWTPLEYILKNQAEGVMDNLPGWCWIKRKDQP